MGEIVENGKDILYTIGHMSQVRLEKLGNVVMGIGALGLSAIACCQFSQFPMRVVNSLLTQGVEAPLPVYALSLLIPAVVPLAIAGVGIHFLKKARTRT